MKIRIKRHIIPILSLWLLLPQAVLSQDNSLSNLRYHFIPAMTDSLLVENHTIVESSIEWQSGPNRDAISIRCDNNQLFIKNRGQSGGILKFRVLDFNLYKGLSVLDSSRITTDERIMLLRDQDDRLLARRFIESGNLEYRGNFTRGISFGNTQDLILNSNLNLQLNGDLGNGMFITAAISDENIPLQPEGNTQVLQEFNKVFIELRKDNTSVTAGDYELGRPKSYFINYFKKLKGISVQTRHRTDTGWEMDNKASFAVSRGKFRRYMLRTTEGNQGPYRLEGENGEIFLQVLSGTERVYADGRLLTRGENNDYIIDYNRAEIRFTPKTIIQANLRIIVEFEYAVQSYLRSLYATETQIQNDKWIFNINAYSEQDSKSTTGNITLDSTDLRILREGGDSQNFKSGISTAQLEEGGQQIAYRLDNGILEYAQEDSTNLVFARFSNFGANQGDYVIDENAAVNGRVYRYAGEGMGSYLPLIRLVPPEQRQMFAASAQFNMRDSSHVFLEAALSNFDLNRFSEIDNEDNSSVGLKARVLDIRPIGEKKEWELESAVELEYLARDFKSLNPFRPQEFVRDWNLGNALRTESQVLAGTRLKLSRKQSWFAYEINSFTEKGRYQGLRHQPELKLIEKGLFINLKGNWLNAEQNGISSQFSRPRILLTKTIIGESLKMGGYLEKEKNIIETESDSLSSESFNYDLYRVFLESNVSDRLSMRLAVSTRLDDRVIDGTLERVTEGRNIEFGGQWTGSAHSDLRWQMVLRDYAVEDNFLDMDKAKKAFIGNIDHKLKLFKGALNVSSYYESNSGQEPKIEFQFVQVQTGEGSYIWNDYNQDSIRQINEFEIAPFSDLAAYEKISVFNNEFISTSRNILNQSIRLDLGRLISNSKNILSRLYFFSRYRIDQKIQSDSVGGIAGLIKFNLNNPELVSYNSSADHSVFINRGQPDWDIQLSLRNINNKILQIVGFDQRSSRRIYSRLRYNIRRSIDAILESEFGLSERVSENFSSQNFDVSSWSLAPQLNYRPSSKFRVISTLKYERQHNRSGIESAQSSEASVQLSWRNSSISSLELSCMLVHIDYQGTSNTPVEFEMLQGLRDGQNMLWSVNYIKRVSNSIDLILNYNGRKSKNSPLVNTATIQMRAIF